MGEYEKNLKKLRKGVMDDFDQMMRETLIVNIVQVILLLGLVVWAYFASVNAKKGDAVMADNAAMDASVEVGNIGPELGRFVVGCDAGSREYRAVSGDLEADLAGEFPDVRNAKDADDEP